MAYTTADAQQQLLDQIAIAVDHIGSALSALGEAYEQLDDDTADRLEERLFRPVQLAYGRAQRTHAGFAERHGHPSRPFEPAGSNARPHGARASIDTAVAAVGQADQELATLQDSLLPVDVGDRELRADLADVRERLGGLPGPARELVRTLGR